MEVKISYRPGFLKKIHLKKANVGIVLKIHGITVETITQVDSDGRAVIDFEQKIMSIHMREMYNHAIKKANAEIAKFHDFSNAYAMNVCKNINSAIQLTDGELFIMIANNLSSSTDAYYFSDSGNKIRGFDCNRVCSMWLYNVEGPVEYELEYLEDKK